MTDGTLRAGIVFNGQFVEFSIRASTAHNYSNISKDMSNMSLRQFITWIEEREARVLRVEEGLHHESTIVSQSPTVEPNAAMSQSAASGNASYFFRVARALDTADEILVVGPSAIKLEFVKYMHKNDHAYDPRILGVETVDSPDDDRLRGYAKLYFTDGGPRRSGNGSGYKGTE